MTQVLGKERSGRVRGLGAGVTPSKVDVALVNSQQIQGLVNLVNSMKERQTMLENLLAQKLGTKLVSVNANAMIMLWVNARPKIFTSYFYIILVVYIHIVFINIQNSQVLFQLFI